MSYRGAFLDALTLKPIIVSMQAESLEVLENADVPPAQARAIVRAIEIELAGAKDTLATKHDILLLRQELRTEIQEVRQQLRTEIQEVRQQLGTEIQEARQELRTEIQEVRQELHTEIQEVRQQLGTEIQEVRQELHQEGQTIRQEMSGLRVEMHAGASSIVRQMYLAVLGQMAVLLGIAYFFVTNVSV